jgi:hypothetical protein
MAAPCNDQSSQTISSPFKRQHQTGPTHHWKHHLLHAGRQPHGPHGSQHHCKQTSQRHRIDNEKVTHPEATVHFYASSMILNAHSDTSYLSETNAHSCACGHFFMGWKPDAKRPIKLNGAFFTLCAILQFVVASAAEAELDALFLNCTQATIF